MKVTKFYILTSALLLSAAVVIWIAFGVSSNKSTREGGADIAVLLDRGEYKSVIDSKSSVVWAENSDPLSFVNLCWAHFQMFEGRENCGVSPASEKGAKHFASALMDAWAGRGLAAAEGLEAIRGDPQWKLWGIVGSLEAASYMEDHSKLEKLLDKHREEFFDKGENFRNTWVHYAAGLHADTANWRGLRNIFSEMEQADIYRSPILLSAYARLMYHEEDIEAYAELIDSAPDPVRGTASYIFARADYVSLVDSPSSGVDALEGYIEGNSDVLPVRVEISLLDLLYGAKGDVDKAREVLSGLANENEHNVRFLLDLAVRLFQYRHDDLAREVAGMAGLSLSGADGFVMSHVLKAWIAVYRGEYKSAETRLDRALAMAPRHFHANWLRAMLARRQDDLEYGYLALSILMDFDRRNQNFCSMIEHFLERSGGDERWQKLARRCR